MKKPVVVLTALLAGACGSSQQGGDGSGTDSPREWFAPGGAATLDYDPDLPFLQFIPGLDLSELPSASQGRELFMAQWELAPGSRSLVDGLGPLAIADACVACHLSAGRAPSLNEDGSIGVGLLFRLGNEQGTADSHYGGQLQTLSLVGSTEADIHWQPGEQGEPVFTVTPHSGDLAEGINLGPRLSPELIGVGLLEQVADETILEYADPDDSDQNGISGRAHWLTVEGEQRLGRFGWKAIQPSLRRQTAAALQQDMGLTNPVFPSEPCTAQQSLCGEHPNGGEPEVSETSLSAINDFMRLLAVPGRRIDDQAVFDRGADLFDSIGCADCHRPTLTTGTSSFPQLSGQLIYPYTDLLLHDMGEQLSDGVREGDASGREWRTPPLWGLGLVESDVNARFLHDGRAASIEEAIGWHGGEAGQARQHYLDLGEQQQQALLDFLRGI